MTLEQETAQTTLQIAVARFDRDLGSARAIRSLARDFPEIFVPVAMQLLLRAPDTAAYRFIAVQLAKQPKAIDHLTDPWQLTPPQAISLSLKLLKADSSFDIQMARRLPPRGGHGGKDTLAGVSVERALDILNEVSVGVRVVPILNHLIEHPNLKVSSKAVLLIGRRVQNVAWARRVISDGGDARLRANALESVWGSSVPEVLELFRNGLEDGDNRVMGNSLVGLHLAGDPQVGAIVVRFANGFNPDFRMTAAWTMGRIGNPSFVPTLAPLLKDTHPGVRRAALKALHGIRQEEVKNQAQPSRLLPPETPEELEASVAEDFSEPVEAEPVEAERAPQPMGFEIRLDGGSRYSR